MRPITIPVLNCYFLTTLNSEEHIFFSKETIPYDHTEETILYDHTEFVSHF